MVDLWRSGEVAERLKQRRSAFRVEGNVGSNFYFSDLRRKLHDGGAWLSGSSPPPQIYHPVRRCDVWRSGFDGLATRVMLFGSRRRRDARFHSNGVVNQRGGLWWEIAVRRYIPAPAANHLC